MNSIINSAIQSQDSSSSPGSDVAANNIDEIVVLAFGAFERYYVCWRCTSQKYHQGQYRIDILQIAIANRLYDQVGSGLPKPLHEWLFPNDGSTRDFPTLQVILGQREEYFAYDKNGRISNVTGSTEQKRTDRQEVRNDQRSPLYRRQTVPSTTSEAALGPKANATRRIVDVTRRRSQSPRQVRPRTQSFLFENQFRWPLGEQDMQRDSYSRLQSGLRNDRDLPPPPPPVCYADAAVQTDPMVFPSDAQSSKTIQDSMTNENRSEIFQSLNHYSYSPTPMAMGTMNVYFRSGSYQLGDILQTSYTCYAMPNT